MHIKVLLENNSLEISQEFQIKGKAGAGKSLRIEKSPKLES